MEPFDIGFFCFVGIWMTIMILAIFYLRERSSEYVYPEPSLVYGIPVRMNNFMSDENLVIGIPENGENIFKVKHKPVVILHLCEVVIES